jgi:hypothetical protein
VPIKKPFKEAPKPAEASARTSRIYYNPYKEEMKPAMRWPSKTMSIDVYRTDPKTGKLESLAHKYDVGFGNQLDEASARQPIDPGMLHAISDANKITPALGVTPKEMVSLLAQEGRTDFGANDLNVEHFAHNKQAVDLYSKLKDMGYDEMQAGLPALMLEKKRVADKMNVPWQAAWQGMGTTETGRTHKDYMRELNLNAQNVGANKPALDVFTKEMQEPSNPRELSDVNMRAWVARQKMVQSEREKMKATGASEKEVQRAFPDAPIPFPDDPNAGLYELTQKYAKGGSVKKNSKESGSVVVDEDGKPVATPLEDVVKEQFGLEPNLDRASLLPYKSKDKGWIAPEALYDIAKLVASPLAALHGTYISPEDAVQGGITLGSPTTAAGLLSKAEPATARMFIGPKSNSWDAKSHALALKMEDEGASPRTIWEQTMNWRQPSGQWAQEISDKGVTYNPESTLAAAKAKYKTDTAAWKTHLKPYEEARNVHLMYEGLKQAEPNPFVERYTEGPAIGMERYHPQTGMPLIKEGMEDDYMNFRQALKEKALQQYAEQTGKPVSENVNWIFRSTPLSHIDARLNAVNPYTRPSAKNISNLPMGKALEHPALYEAYPNMPNYPFNVRSARLMKGAEASFSPYNREIKLSATSSEPTPSLLHELQHAVQAREGWEGGTSPSRFAPLPSEISHQLYLRNLGEGMARATEARKDLSMAQRNALFPAESFSLPRVSPATTMDQFMWQGMDPDKKRAIFNYLNNNMDELTWKGRMTGKDVDIPLAYDPDKVQAIADGLTADLHAPVEKFNEGGQVNFTYSDTPDQKYTETMGQDYADANIVGYAEGGNVKKRLAYVSGKQDEPKAHELHVQKTVTVIQPLAEGGLVAPTDQMSYDPARVQSIADQLRQEMYDG